MPDTPLDSKQRPVWCPGCGDFADYGCLEAGLYVAGPQASPGCDRVRNRVAASRRTMSMPMAT